jgi:spore coat-associated protein N
MKRFKILFGQRRFQLLASLGAVVLAVSVVAASGASFTAHSANASNIYSTGTLAMTNTPTGMSTTIANMVPGDYHDATVVIKNTGDVQGHFYLEAANVTSNSKSIAQYLDLEIKDGSTVVYSGKLSDLPQKDLGTWAANDQHTYSFKVSFPDAGRATGVNGAGGVGNDNQYMGASTTVDFNWTAVSVAQGSR